ncbi:MAG: hypothetical protein EOO40_06355 [Deltaproteobacteria bacterium]|nr:MAG: hypothetical protein EOO40_06355 [Deltaproteobacteria bacterium]
MEETLLLMVLERLHEVERAVTKLSDDVNGNPLRYLTPSTCPSVEQEGTKISRRLAGVDRYPFSVKPDELAATCQIKHQVNVDLLRRQGFVVEKEFQAPLPTDVYRVTWCHLPS